MKVVFVEHKNGRAHACRTCTRSTRSGPMNAVTDCAIYEDLPGAGGYCDSWTDDPDWELRAELLTERYARARRIAGEEL